MQLNVWLNAACWELASKWAVCKHLQDTYNNYKRLTGTCNTTITLNRKCKSTQYNVQDSKCLQSNAIDCGPVTSEYNVSSRLPFRQAPQFLTGFADAMLASICSNPAQTLQHYQLLFLCCLPHTFHKLPRATRVTRADPSHFHAATVLCVWSRSEVRRWGLICRKWLAVYIPEV